MVYIKIIQDVTFEIYFESTHIDSGDAITNQLAIVKLKNNNKHVCFDFCIRRFFITL